MVHHQAVEVVEVVEVAVEEAVEEVEVAVEVVEEAFLMHMCVMNFAGLRKFGKRGKRR